MEDIPLLAEHFVDLAVKELECQRPRLTRAGIETLQCYDWPGNIRELRNVIERATIFARGGALEFDLASYRNRSVDASFEPSGGNEANQNTLLTQKCGGVNAQNCLRGAAKSRLENQRRRWSRGAFGRKADYARFPG